jgi:hypothetical protein
MPQSPAKVFARVFSYSSPDTPANGALKFTIEWRLLQAPFESGKISITPDPITSDTRLKDDLRDALSTYLSTRYFPVEFRPRDIVGYSV